MYELASVLQAALLKSYMEHSFSRTFNILTYARSNIRLMKITDIFCLFVMQCLNEIFEATLYSVYVNTD